MISRKTAVFAILSAAVLSTGCSRTKTAGEQMIRSDSKTAVLDANRPDTGWRPVVRPTAPDVVAPPTTVAVVTRPTTTTVSTQPLAATAPTSRPERLWVAADADAATRMRNWKPSYSYYPTGNTIAGPVYRILPPEPRTRNADDIVWMDAYTDLLAIGGIFATPVWVFITPPNTPIEYTGVEYPPSYTLADPRPDDYVMKIPGIVQLRREYMSQEWVEKTVVREPAGSSGGKRVEGSSLDSLPGDRR